jgi:dihydrofolate synthase/folylpolyglutamate synthase
MPALGDYNATRDYLYSLKSKGSKYGIDRMRGFVRALGHPERQFPIIHVAGSNGKGSTCSMLEALYRANGYCTGLYSSPHLVRQGERVQVNRTVLDESEIVRYARALQPIAAQLGATNVVDPELAIITSISLDHTELLGDSIEQIAREKAGIIKCGKPVLISKLPAAAEAVIRGIAAERGSRVYAVTERFCSFEQLPHTNLRGSCQRWNAGVALYASEILSQRFPVQAGPSVDALQSIHWPGRWQTLQLQDRTLILDASHNPEGAAILDENLTQLVADLGHRPIIVAGTLGEDRARSLLEVVSRHAREIHLLAPDQSRATPTAVLASCLPNDNRAPVHHPQLKAIFPAVASCTLGKPGDTIVVTGSLYLIGEVLEQLTCDTPVGQGQLQDSP